jgi:DNA-binding NarL/FixJ family response regulator
MNIRVLITDDHELVRAGLVSLFDVAVGIEVAAEAANGEELLLKLRMTPVDLLLLDMDMPGENGLELIRHIKQDYPDLPMLILSMHDEVRVVSRAIQAGAAGYICKDCAPKTLIEAVHKTMATGKYLAPLMAEQLAYAASMPEVADAASVLSDREMEVFRLLIEGNSNDIIAKQLFISDRTVSAHKANLQNKLGLKNIVELVHYALQHKLFSTT